MTLLNKKYLFFRSILSVLIKFWYIFKVLHSSVTWLWKFLFPKILLLSTWQHFVMNSKYTTHIQHGISNNLWFRVYFLWIFFLVQLLFKEIPAFFNFTVLKRTKCLQKAISIFFSSEYSETNDDHSEKSKKNNTNKFSLLSSLKVFNENYSDPNLNTKTKQEQNKKYRKRLVIEQIRL